MHAFLFKSTPWLELFTLSDSATNVHLSLKYVGHSALYT